MIKKPNRFITKEYAGLFEVFSRIIDISSITVGLFVTVYLFSSSGLQLKNALALLLIKSLICLITFKESQVYRSWRGRPYSDQFSRLFIAFAISSGFTILVWLVIDLNLIISIEALLIWLILSLLLIIACRVIVFTAVRHLRKKGVNQKKIIIYGAGRLGKSIVNQLLKSPESGFIVMSLLDDNRQLHGNTISNLKVIGGKEKLASISKTEIDEIWVALPLSAGQRIHEVLRISCANNVSVRLIPDLFGLSLLNHSVTEFLGFPMIDISVNKMVGLNKIIKMLEDKILGSIFLIISSPLLVIISFLLLLTSGQPIIFLQKRIGWDGKIFTIYKFRTMKVHKEAGDQITQAIPNDVRFTKVGKWLRKTSLDELPQIINVLQGRMSLVGPRPHALKQEDEFKKKIEGYVLRYKVKPGITGWAQVNDLRGEVKSIDDINRRLQHDLFYIENWSLWFDIRILLTTSIKIFFSKQAW